MMMRWDTRRAITMLEALAEIITRTKYHRLLYTVKTGQEETNKWNRANTKNSQI